MTWPSNLLFLFFSLTEVIEEAIEASDEEYGVAAAVQWADGYRSPTEMVSDSAAGLYGYGAAAP